jgi:hypothetical protein
MFLQEHSLTTQTCLDMRVFPKAKDDTDLPAATILLSCTCHADHV